MDTINENDTINEIDKKYSQLNEYFTNSQEFENKYIIF